MARPNPKTYPFNYVVHEEDLETDCDSFVEANAYVALNFPEGVHEEYWSTDEGSPLKRLPWSEFADPHKYVWRSKSDAEEFSQLNAMVEQGKTSEARTFLEKQDDIDLADSDDDLDLLAGFVFARTVCSIERRRDAYEAAMEEWESEVGRDDDSNRDGEA